MSDPELPLPRIPEEEREYFQRIEERFCALRGGTMLLSPRDWKLITDWRSSGIPLPLILESLEEVFAARARRADPAARVNSLAYVAPEVLRRWELHRELTSPRSAEEGEGERLRREVRRHLGRMNRRLREAAQRARSDGSEPLSRLLEVAATEVARLRREAGGTAWDPHRIEASLAGLDREVLQAAREGLDEPEARAMEIAVSGQLEPRRGEMRPEILAETRRALEDRHLRQRFLIPRIALPGLG